MSALRNLVISLIVLITAAMPAASEGVPLEISDGVYMLPVRINDAVTIPFIVDSGAAEVVIPADVFLVLSRTGTVSQTDFLGTGTYVMANGTTQTSKRFRLRKLVVGSHVVADVVAIVSPVNGEPLLGQSFLSRLPAWSIDNARHTLVLNDTGVAAPPAATGYAPAPSVVTAPSAVGTGGYGAVALDTNARKVGVAWDQQDQAWANYSAQRVCNTTECTVRFGVPPGCAEPSPLPMAHRGAAPFGRR